MLLASSVSGLFKWRQFEPEVILTRDFLFGLLIAVVSRLVAGRSLAAFSVYCLLAREPKKIRKSKRLLPIRRSARKVVIGVVRISRGSRIKCLKLGRLTNKRLFGKCDAFPGHAGCQTNQPYL